VHGNRYRRERNHTAVRLGSSLPPHRVTRPGFSPGSLSRETDAFSAVVVQNLDGVVVEDGEDGAGGSQTLKRHGARFMIETGAVSLRSVSLFTVYL